MVDKFSWLLKYAVCFLVALLLLSQPTFAQKSKQGQRKNVVAKSELEQSSKQKLPVKELKKVDIATAYAIWLGWYEAQQQGIKKPVPVLRVLNANEKETKELNGIWGKGKLKAEQELERRAKEKNKLTAQNQGQPRNLTIDPVRNRITNPGYKYDLAGNLIAEPGATYDYDAENRLIKAVVNGVVTNYFYDGLGRRVQKIANGVTTRFVYDYEGRLIAEYEGDPVGSLSRPSKEYYYGPNGLLATSDENGNLQFHTPDHQGTTRVITNSMGKVVSRRDFYPFGEQIEPEVGGRAFISGYVSNDSLRQKFTGYERDEETGLDFAQARYFNSGLGRFMSIDPLGKSEKLEDPQTWNRYAYVLNNPLRYTDPDGQAPQEGADIRQRQDIKDLMDGKITQQQYQDRQKARAVGAVIGVGLVGTGFVGLRALPVFIGLAGRNPQAVEQVTNEVVQMASGSPLPTPSNIIAGNFGKASFKLTEEALEVDVKIIANKGEEGLAALTKFKMAAIDKAKELGASKVVINTGPILEESGKLVKILDKLVKKGEAVKLAQPGSPKYQITINVPK
jgi:RHS repeat-associated protein